MNYFEITEKILCKIIQQVMNDGDKNKDMKNDKRHVTKKRIKERIDRKRKQCALHKSILLHSWSL